MRVFITGATGFIGSATVRELIAAGHEVIGLARSKEKAAALAAAGAEILMGTVEDADILREGVSRADGVIHTAFNHDFSTFRQNCEDDRKVIGILGAALAGSDRPLVVTSGTGMAGITMGAAGDGTASNDRPVTEEDKPVSSEQMPRAASEEAAAAAGERGTNVSVMRLPQVHDPRRQGFVSFAIMVAQQKGASAYVGEGANRWPAAHVSDVARLYRLALEKAAPGAIYNAVGEEGVAVRDIAEVLGRRLALPVRSIRPEEAEAHFGFLGHFAGLDMPASSALTRERLGWVPKGPTMLEDLDNLQLSE